MGCLTSCDRLMRNPSALRMRSRSKRPFMTIRTRLTLWYSSLLATVIVVFGISLFSILNWTWRSQIKESMSLVAQQTAENILIDPTSGEIVVHSPEALDVMSTYPFGIQVRGADGTLVRASGN